MTLSDDPKRDGRIRDLEKENERLQGEVTRWVNLAMTGEGVREKAMLALALGSPSPPSPPVPPPQVSTTMRWYEVATGWWMLFRSGVDLPIAAVVDTDPAGLAAPICGECGVECERQRRDSGRWRCPQCDELYATEVIIMIADEINGERVAMSRREKRWTVRDATHNIMEHLKTGKVF